MPIHTVHNILFTPLTPPPDSADAFSNTVSNNSAHISDSPFSSKASTASSDSQSQLDLNLNIGRTLLGHSHLPGATAALAFDAHGPATVPTASPNQHAFRYVRDLAPSSGSASAPSGGELGIYHNSPPALEHSSDAATLATSVSGYPCSPPPSRHHSEHAGNRDKLSGASHFSTQSPTGSPSGQAATSAPDRLNLTSINAQTLPDHYHATFSASNQPEHQSEQRSHLNQTQQHQQVSSQLRTPSAAHSPSDRFPPIASMLSPNRYSRIDRHPFPTPGHERRISDPSDNYSGTKLHPPSMTMGGGYGTTSFTLHRVERSGSYPEIGAASGFNSAAWHDEEREKLYIDDRTRANFDPYSPIHSSFSSSNSSIATQALPSPHAPPYYSRGYTGPSGGGYALYGPSEDVPYDTRPQTGSSDSNSPSYPYSQGSLPSGSRNLPSTLAHQPDYGNYGGADPSSKTYSFVSLPGNTVRKRPRRRYDEIERLYACNFPGCTKAYGTLNHLNAHVNMQKHGPKRHPNEFKEMRKQWRKMKKEQEAERERMAQLESMPSVGNPSLSDMMRRRRATDPSAYGMHGINPGEDVSANGHPSGSVAASVGDPLGISSLDTTSYGLSSSLPMSVGSDPISSMTVGGGYGQQQQQYSSSAGYHGQQRPSISPASPSGPSDTFGRFTGSSGSGIAGPLSESPTNYYSSSGGFEQGRTRTPPPRNQLPPDSTLCSPYTHSQQPDVGGDSYGLPGMSSAASMDQRGRHGS